MVGLKELKDLNSILFSFELTTIVLTTLSSSSAVSTSLSLRANAKMELIFRFRRVKFLKGDPEPILGCESQGLPGFHPDYLAVMNN